MPGPLDGFRVVDLTAVVSGPVATMILADQGADVIKVEPPGAGDLLRSVGPVSGGISASFSVINRNKRSLALNLKDERGYEILLDLVRSADVFAQNFRPGVAARMGIDFETLRPVQPELVYLSISGFGEDGPYADKRVYDPLVQGISGMARAQTNPATGEPDLIRQIVCDKVTGYTAAQAVTAALLARDRGAGGQHLKLSMLDASVAFLWPDVMVNETFLQQEIERSPTLSDRSTLRKTADGYVTALAVTDAEFHGLCRALGRPDVAEDPRFASVRDRNRHFQLIKDLLGGEIEKLPTQELCARLDAEHVPCGILNAPSEVPRDPQVVHNGTLVEERHPLAGWMRAPRPPTQFGRTPAALRIPAPALGQHSDEVLAELGRSEAQIAQLREDGAIA